MRSNLPAPSRYLDRRVTGSPAYVRQTLMHLAGQRRLVSVSPARGCPEGVTVTVRILDRPRPATPARRRRWPVVAVVAGAGVTVLGVAAYALVRLVDAVIAALPVIGGALLLLALAALFTRGGRERAVCVTLHGPRCHGHH